MMDYYLCKLFHLNVRNRTKTNKTYFFFFTLCTPKIAQLDRHSFFWWLVRIV